MSTFLFDFLYYAMPIVAAMWICWKLFPVFNKDLPRGRINPIYVLITVAVFALCFIVNAFIWATAVFFVLRG